MKLHIFYRMCDIVNCVNGQRPYQLSKKDIIDSCFTSLIDSLKIYKGEYNLTVIGDELSDERISFIKKYDSKANIINEKFGNTLSLKKSFNLAENVNDNDIVFFCEDDYFFLPEAIKYLMNMFHQKDEYLFDFKNNYLFLFPWDSPKKYARVDDTSKKIMPSYRIFVSEFCHWREITSTTYTLLCKVSTFKKYKDLFYKYAVGAKDNKMSLELYTKDEVLLLSPIPSLSKHLNMTVMKPTNKNWEILIKEQLRNLC